MFLLREMREKAERVLKQQAKTNKVQLRLERKVNLQVLIIEERWDLT
jgi:hypothetical protein